MDYFLSVYQSLATLARYVSCYTCRHHVGNSISDSFRLLNTCHRCYSNIHVTLYYEVLPATTTTSNPYSLRLIGNRAFITSFTNPSDGVTFIPHYQSFLPHALLGGPPVLLVDWTLALVRYLLQRPEEYFAWYGTSAVHCYCLCILRSNAVCPHIAAWKVNTGWSRVGRRGCRQQIADCTSCSSKLVYFPAAAVEAP
jgi:hypothetical protein